MVCAGRHHLDALARGELAVNDAHVGDDSAVCVVYRVEDHGAGGSIGVTHGWGDEFDDAVEQRIHADAGFARHTQNVFGLATNEVCELFGVLLWISSRQVDFVENGDDRQIVLHSEIQVRQCLRLYTLSGIDEQDCALAGCE
ncbi:unannotated protein [freshwater metagenome]|uniref:Unannotated protein n=1 Tax=freshwater metagenome TaxID=449393 RepID=A0A6J6DWD2_9ZZZZ